MRSLEYQAYLLAELLGQQLGLGEATDVTLTVKPPQTTFPAIAKATEEHPLNPSVQSRKVPLNARYFFERGVGSLDSENYEAAIADLTHALRINPNFAAAYAARAEAYAKQGEHQKSARDYNQAYSILVNISFNQLVQAQGYPKPRQFES